MLLLLLLSLQIALACASSTLYSFGDGKIYVHLDNNDLVMLNFAISGLSTSKYSEDSNYKDGQSIDTIASPPLNSTLFLIGTELYAMAGDGTRTACGYGTLELFQYHKDSDDWAEIECDTSEIDDSAFLLQASYLTSPLSDEVYMYGGRCQSGSTSNRLLSFNATTCQFKNISTSTTPHSFYGAANILAPDPQTQLLVGGESEAGWLNMYQLATWNFQSGWSFKSVSSQNSTDVASRVGALVLPVFTALENNSIETFASAYKVNQVVLVGGTMDGKEAAPQMVMLNTDSNDWSYTTVNATNIQSGALGFAAIFNNLIGIGRSPAKRDSSYILQLYNIGDEFQSVNEIVDNLQKPKSNNTSSGSTNIQKKAILGTVIPVCAIFILLGAGYFVMKKVKKDKAEKELEKLNHEYDNYFDRLEREKARKNQHPDELRHNLLFNDSNSTIDVNSIDSWVKKRHEFDNQKKLRNTYMASQETLNDETTSLSPYPTTPAPVKTIDKLNKSMLKLRKSLSFSNLPSPDRKTSNQFMNEEMDYEAEIENIQPENPFEGPDTHTDLDDISDSDSSIDNDRDVQVLVSSKRRSTLRVVNPDLANIDEESMRSTYTHEQPGVRQRVPSNERNNDD